MSELKDPIRYKRTEDSVDCFTAMESAFGIDALITFCKLNAFKYIWREKFKGGKVDMEKAQVYISKYLELLQRKDDNGYAD